MTICGLAASVRRRPRRPRAAGGPGRETSAADRSEATAIENDLQFVRPIVDRYAYEELDVDDLFQEGCVALLEARSQVEACDDEQFTAFAATCVEKAIRRVVEEDQESIPIPIGRCCSIRDEQSKSPDEKMESVDFTRIVASLLVSLKPREERVLRLRFGLTGRLPLTLDAIAQEFSISRQSIHVIEARLGYRKTQRRNDWPAARQRTNLHIKCVGGGGQNSCAIHPRGSLMAQVERRRDSSPECRLTSEAKLLACFRPPTNARLAEAGR